jgi:acetyl esterase/lipase
MNSAGTSRGGIKPLRYARRLMRARPADYILAASTAATSIPVIGRHLEPLGGFCAMGLWSVRYASDFAGAIGKPRLPTRRIDGAERLQNRHTTTSAAVTAGLASVLAPADLANPWPSPAARAPFREAGAQRKSVYRASVQYGDHPSQLLDVWRRKDLPAGPAPVMVFIPGGAWVFGSRQLQGHTLMAHLVEQGWVCLSLQYRTSPKNRWPRQLTDVKTAIAWARDNIGEFGGNANFVTVAGCSAGGHLASLVGLTSTPDTAVDAVVSIYGSYDWEDRSNPGRVRFMDFLERVVVQRRQSRHPEIFRDASPVAQVNADAPPFLVIHGTKDFLIPVGEARSFVEKLRAVSSAPVAYVEVPGAQHGFDLTDATRTGTVIAAIGLFVNHIHRVGPTSPVTAVV